MKLKLTHSFLIVINIFAIPDFILHVLYLFLSWIESHTTHHISNGTQRYLSIQLPSFSRMLVFGSNLTIVEEIFQITHDLSIRSSFQQVRIRIAFWFFVEALSQDREIYFPHINTKIISSRCKEEFAINHTTDGCDSRWVCN